MSTVRLGQSSPTAVLHRDSQKSMLNRLYATEVFIADLIACSTCFGHRYAHRQELKSIIQWLLPVVLRAVVFKLLVWLYSKSSILQTGHITLSSTPDQQLENHSMK